MIASRYVCAVLMVSCCLEFQAIGHLSFDNSLALSPVSRIKRGVAEYLTKLGQAAAEFLLKGTKQITSPKESVFRMFQKRGSLDDAMNDFRSVNPSYVWEYKNQYGGTVWEGRVGDRHLIVRSNGQTPTLDIIDYRKARVAYSGKSFTSGKFSFNGICNHGFVIYHSVI